jgi:hypothetical protein
MIPYLSHEIKKRITYMPTKSPQPQTTEIPKLYFPGFKGAWEEKR